MVTINNLIVVEVLEDAYDFKLTHYKQHTVLNYSYTINKNKANVSINDGEFNVILNNAKILGKLSELSEEECKPFVEQYTSEGSDIFGISITLYKDYESNLFDFDYAKEALFSLLQSHGVDINNPNTLLILEKL